MTKDPGWIVGQIGEAHKQEVAKSVTTVLERETKLDSRAIEMMTQAVQSILLREVGSVVGEILDAEPSGAHVLVTSCSNHACSGNGLNGCPSQSCGVLTCSQNFCSVMSCGTKVCSGHFCGTNAGIVDFFETPAWTSFLKDIELMTKYPELRQKINVSTRITGSSEEKSEETAVAEKD
jgi:hypothetical protein